jgi:hypothetical protein
VEGNADARGNAESESGATESVVRGLVDGLGDRPHGVVESHVEESNDTQAGATSNQGAEVRAVRDDNSKAGEASCRLQQATRSEHPLHKMSSEGRSRGRDATANNAEELQHVRKDVSAISRYARHALWFSGLRFQLWEIFGSKEMGWQAADQTLRLLWQRVSIQEAQRDDLWEIVRQQARLRTTARELIAGVDNRVDRLRLGGNGVVVLQAAVAFTVLFYRLTDGER